MKVFRKIRQNQLKNGKTVKYLKYAIGEIALVVIGILIALSINNYNNNQLDRATEEKFYFNTKQQLLDDAINIRSQLDYNSRYNAQYKYALELIELNNRSTADSLGLIAANLINYSDFDRQGNIYETMVNSGNIKLLKNDQIIEGLRRLEETYIYVNRMESIHFDMVMSIAPQLMQTIRLNTNLVEKENTLYDYSFQNIFFISLRIMDEKDTVYHRALEEIDKIIKLIDTEMEN